MASPVSKDPDEVVDFVRDWSPGLAPGDAIASSTWAVPAGITKLEQAPRVSSHDDTTTTVWLSGGSAGTTYECVNRVQTTGGRTYERTLRVAVIAR